MIKFLTRSLASLPALKLQVFVQRELIAKLSHSLERSVERNRKLVDEVASLRKGTMAGFHEAASAALDNVVESARVTLGAYEHEPLGDAAQRVMKLARSLEERSTKLAEELAGERQKLATIRNVGGVEEAARRLISFRPGETLFQACKRVSDELKATTAERDSITGERDQARRELHGAKQKIANLADELEEAKTETTAARHRIEVLLRRVDELAGGPEGGAREVVDELGRTAVGHGAG